MENTQVLLNIVWTMVGAFLVYFMQAGFAMVETGFTRAKNSGNILMKNMMDFVLGSIFFFIIGFALMFGGSNAFIGTAGFFHPKSLADADGMFNGLPIGVFMIFQTVFCATSATIVSGAMAERTKFISYLIYSAAISIFIYPITGHWIWGGGWLSQIGFHDFAGSTAVHMVGGLCALAGAKMVGPRIGKYTKEGKPVAVVSDKDSVVFFNFRPDRAREITRAFCDDDFKGFERKTRPHVTFVCFTDYDDTIQNKLVAFHKVQLKNTFGEYLAAHNMTQARIAETEKYAHVTFFFNGGVEEPNKGEDRILVKSPKVATYDLQPEMSAPQVCEKLVEAIKADKYDVIVINFANPDMVGHTGVEAAAIKAVETVDECVGKAVKALKEVDGQMFICADHGNAEQLIDYETGEPWTAHTTNPVPFILVNADPKYTLREGGCLADIVPTMIQLMGMEQPAEMTGKSLLIEK